MPIRRTKKKSQKDYTSFWDFILVRVTRLELVRHGHTPLKRACLPIPAHSHLFNFEPCELNDWYYTTKKSVCQ